MTYEDMGAYELITDAPVNVHEIVEKWECGEGEGKFWMVCVESDEGMIRFRGMFAPEDGRPWVRVFIDFSRDTLTTIYVNAPSGQHMSKLEVAREVQKELGGTLYKNGEMI